MKVILGHFEVVLAVCCGHLPKKTEVKMTIRNKQIPNQREDAHLHVIPKMLRLSCEDGWMLFIHCLLHVF